MDSRSCWSADTGSGKTSLLYSYACSGVPKSPEERDELDKKVELMLRKKVTATSGMDNISAFVRIGNKPLRIGIWDTGTIQFPKVIQPHFLVYNITAFPLIRFHTHFIRIRI